MAPDELLARLSSTLRHDIGPAVVEPFPKTQAFMASVVLEKLSAQIRLAPAHTTAEAADMAALACDHRHHRHAQGEATFRRARDDLSLAALLGADAGIGAGCVHEAHNRQRKALCHVHQAHGFAIAFRPRHSEIVLQSFLRCAALFVAQYHHRPAHELARAAQDRGVLPVIAVAG